MHPTPINQLILKGTHNSYSCTGEDTPAMNHPVDVQIDDFGVWALELDFGVKRKNGVPTALVGHDDEGQATCFMSQGFELVRLLSVIRGVKALQYRPVFIFFDIKPWNLIPGPLALAACLRLSRSSVVILNSNKV